MQDLQPQGLDLEKAASIECTECGNDRFIVHYMLKELSALVSPTGQDTIIPIQVFACSNCKHIDDRFLP